MIVPRPVDDDRLAARMADLVDAEFRAALAALGRRGDWESAIHDARRHIKKIRAIVRMLRTSSPPVHDHRLRSASRKLSSLRDVDALVETVQRLGKIGRAHV